MISILILHHKVRKPRDRLKMKVNYLPNIVSETGMIRRSNKREKKKEFTYLLQRKKKLIFL